jgi:hypothetical protein
MNAQIQFFRRKEFWGVAAMLVAWIVVTANTPIYRMSFHKAQWAAYSSKHAGYVTSGLDEVGGGGAGGDPDQFMAFSLAPSSPSARNMIRKGSIALVVRNPRESAERIRSFAEQAGGFLVSSEIDGGENAPKASLTIRVPAAKFEQVISEVARLGVRVEAEKLEAEDVTRQYVDLAARLRNYRAQETQYLGILKQARTVKDTVDVSEKLGEVRGEIEQQQAEFDALSKQVETVALTVSLHAEAEVQVFGLHWRPLYQLKPAVRDGIDGIGDYTSSMASFIFYVPAILLWLATILIGAAIAWRGLRWAARALFMSQTKPAVS